MRPILSIAVLVLLAFGCGGGSDPTTVDTPATDDPALPPPSTNIIGVDSFHVVPVEVRVFGDPNFLMEWAKGGVVPQGLVPSDGKLLVLSVKDVTDPDLICGTGNWGPTCASMILIEQEGLDPGRLPGRLELNTSGGRKIWFPQADTLTLAEAPPPGWPVFQVGGSAHQWSVLLDGDITPGSDFDVRLTVGKVGGTPTRLAWQLSIEEPTVLTAPGEVHDDC